jgi:cysteine desulfurase/selenocysteine lyase
MSRAALAPRADFPVLDEVVYLNTGSIGLESLPVQRAAEELGRQIAGRGTVGFDDEVEKEIFDIPRAAAARLLGAEPDDVALVTHATEALCQVAWWLKPAAGENVVSSDLEFPSVTYPWLRLAVDTGVELRLAPALGDPGTFSLDTIAAAVDEKTAVICVSHVQYATGHRLDPAALVELARSVGATLVLDATQSAGVVPLDAPGLDVDVLVTSGYKWLCSAPGVGVCFLRRELSERLDPPFVGWRSVEDQTAYDATKIALAPGARRLEYSTPAYAAGAALSAAVDYLLELGIMNVLAHDLALAAELRAGLESLGAEVLTPAEDDRRAGIVVSRFPGRSDKELAARLAEAGVIVSPRLGAVRFSLHVFNDSSDVERALDALGTILGDPAGRVTRS